MNNYMKYAIASESITVDGVPLHHGFNSLNDREFNKLSRSKFRNRGIYELHDQEVEAQDNLVNETVDEVVEAKTNPSGTAVEVDLAAKNYRELQQIAKQKGINTKGLSKVKILAAIKEQNG
jgi:hypothetical protein